MMFRLSNAMVRPADPECAHGGEDLGGVRTGKYAIFQYFARFAEDPRKNPRDDLARALANGRVGLAEPIVAPVAVAGRCNRRQGCVPNRTDMVWAA